MESNDETEQRELFEFIKSLGGDKVDYESYELTNVRGRRKVQRATVSYSSFSKFEYENDGTYFYECVPTKRYKIEYERSIINGMFFCGDWSDWMVCMKIDCASKRSDKANKEVIEEIQSMCLKKEMEAKKNKDIEFSRALKSKIGK